MLQVGAKVTVLRGLPLVNFYLGDSFTYKRMWQVTNVLCGRGEELKRRRKINEIINLQHSFITHILSVCLLFSRPL